MAKRKNKAKTLRLSRAKTEALAAIASKYASVEALKPAAQGREEIDPEWLRIKESLSIPEVIKMVKAAQPKRKGAPVKAKTLRWIERLRNCKRQGRTYLGLASEFRPDLSLPLAQAAIRKFHSRHREQIEA